MVFASCFSGLVDNDTTPRINGKPATWVTEKPKRQGVPSILFLGLDGAGKSSVIRTLMNGPSPPPSTSSGTLAIPAPPPQLPPLPTVQPECSYMPAAPRGPLSGASWVAVEVGGGAAARSGWGDGVMACDALVLVVDISDSPRYAVLREWVWRVHPRMAKRAMPCVVLAVRGRSHEPLHHKPQQQHHHHHDAHAHHTLGARGASAAGAAAAAGSGSAAAGKAAVGVAEGGWGSCADVDDVIAELDLATLFAQLPAPWAVRVVDTHGYREIAEAVAWLLAQAQHISLLLHGPGVISAPPSSGGATSGGGAGAGTERSVRGSSSSGQGRPVRDPPAGVVLAALRATNQEFAAQFAAQRALAGQQAALAALQPRS